MPWGVGGNGGDLSTIPWAKYPCPPIASAAAQVLFDFEGQAMSLSLLLQICHFLAHCLKALSAETAQPSRAVLTPAPVFDGVCLSHSFQRGRVSPRSGEALQLL